MESATCIIFLLPLALCLTFQPLLIVAQATHNSTQNSIHNSTLSTSLLEKVCNQSIDKDFCYSSLKTNPESENVHDLTGLAMIALNIASSNASGTLEHIKIIRSNSTLGPVVEQNLDDCMDQYLDASEQLDDSVAALTANAYQDVRLWVEAAISDAVACEEGFKRNPGKASVLSHYNNMFRKLCHVILGINRLLAHM